jgi:hypothetical protein
MAAWEFGAGQMPHWAARLFCLPLVLLGLAWSARTTWRAFLAGRHSRSLHGAKLDQRVLAAPFDDLHAELAGPQRVGALSAYLLFARLVVEAILIVSAPPAMIAGLWLALRT